MSQSTPWTNTRVALREFMQLLACNKCKQRPTDPVRYIDCQHLFCSSCITQDSSCFICGVPVQPNDKLFDHITSTVVSGCDEILNIIFADGDKEDEEEPELDEEGPELNEESSADIFSSTTLSKTIVNKNTFSEEIPSNKQEKSDGSDKTEKMDDTVGDTLRLNDSDELENLRNTANVVQKNTVTDTNTKKLKRSERQSQRNLVKSSQKIPKDVNKKNIKGESLLHQACLKQDEGRVKMLLENGANPNTKDHTNWTPLLECVSYGWYNMCELLLENGALPDTPGIDNKTALHEAVINNRCREAALLLRYEANPNVFDQFGKRPIDYCESDEMKKILFQENILNETAEKLGNISSCLNRTIGPPITKIVVLGCNLQKSTHDSLSQLASKHKIKIVNSFASNVTHVVVDPDQKLFLNYDLLLSILHGKWILNTEWIQIGLTLDSKDFIEMDLDIFEMKFLTYNDTPSRARLNTEKQNPSLFNNCYFFFALSSTETYMVGQLSLTKKNLTKLCIEGGGNYLSREPNPEEIQDQIIPFHAASNKLHPLHKCSHFIIYAPGKEEPRIKYNMPHIKTLPLVWFIECIEKFMLVDPALFGII